MARRLSQVAKDDTLSGAEHGAAVSARAQSDCGKTDAETEDSVAPTTAPPAEVVCPDDVDNHGEAVSQVAKDHTVTGAEHGAAVSAMAQSDCGKTGTEGTESDDESEADDSSSSHRTGHTGDEASAIASPPGDCGRWGDLVGDERVDHGGVVGDDPHGHQVVERHLERLVSLGLTHLHGVRIWRVLPRG